MKKIILYSLLIIWMTIIFIFSNQKGNESTSSSSRFINTFIDIYEKISNNKLDNQKKEYLNQKLSYPVRKLAHLTVYLILGVLICNIVLLYDLDIKKIILISILFCMMYAVSDEIHQMFVSGRDGRVLDVAIDTIGSIVGILFTLVISKNFHNKIIK